MLRVVKATMLAARLDGGAIWRPSRPTLDLARLGAPEGGLGGEALDLALELRDLRRGGVGAPRQLRLEGRDARRRRAAPLLRLAMPKERRSPPVDEVFSHLERQRNVALAQAAQARKNSPTFLGERIS